MKNNTNLKTYSQDNNEYEIRKELHEGKEHIIVPVIMMVEGVHSGSKGAILHLANEMGKIPGAWNGIPAVINHPKKDDEYISANSPEVLDSQSVGRIYNTHMNGKKLMAEAWLDPVKLEKLSALAFDHIINQKPLDVSIGAFTEDEDEEGEYNNEIYNAIATNYRPDHLALLPGGEGACNWNDGCGIRVNKQGEKPDTKKEAPVTEGKQEMFLAMRKLNELGFSVNKLVINKDGFTVIMDIMRRKLYSMDSDGVYHYLEELYDNSVIYSKRTNGEEKLYKQAYVIVDDVVELVGEPTQVIKHVDISYTTNTLQRTKFNINKKEDVIMSDEKKPCGQCMEKVVAIIQSNETPYTEKQREWLLTQEEAFLDKLIPKEPEMKKPEAVQVNKEQAMAVLKETIKNQDDFINLLPDDMKDSMRSGLALHEDARKKMIDEIQSNATDVWTKEELTVMNFDTLKKVHGSMKIPVVDYSLNGGTPSINNNADMEVLVAPGIEIKE